MAYFVENFTNIHSGYKQARLASLRELQSATGEELSPPFHFGDATQSALLLSVQSKPALSHVEGSAFQKG